jgi:uncharacterized membrane protein
MSEKEELTPVSMRHSDMARNSLLIGLISFFAWILIFIIYSPLTRLGFDKVRDIMIGIELLMMILLAANLVGIILGVIALFKKISNRKSAITGILLNITTFTIIVALIILFYSIIN